MGIAALDPSYGCVTSYGCVISHGCVTSHGCGNRMRTHSRAVRAVLIDLDDTLVDHHHAMLTALRELHDGDTRLHALEFEFLQSEWQRVLDAMHNHMVHGRVTLQETRIRRYRHIYQLA